MRDKQNIEILQKMFLGNSLALEQLNKLYARTQGNTEREETIYRLKAFGGFRVYTSKWASLVFEKYALVASLLSSVLCMFMFVEPMLNNVLKNC